MRFCDFLVSSSFSKILSIKSFGTCETTHIYQFITNNQTSFHLCWKKNLVNHQRVSKYYEHNCLQNFLLLLCLYQQFLYLKTVIFYPEFPLSFWKNVLYQTRKAFNTKLGSHWKYQKSNYQVRQILALFCKLVVLNFRLKPHQSP